MNRFPSNEIISLVDASPRHDLAESVGPDLRLGELSAPSGLEALSLAYGTAAGDPRLRAAIARRNSVGPDDVVVTVGSMHALFLLAFILCNRDNEVVVAGPCFPPTRDVLRAVGARIRVLQLSFNNRYHIDPIFIGNELSAATKLVSLASPQNPSGVAIPASVLRQVLVTMEDICPHAYLLVDETYREACYGTDPVADPAVILSPRVITVASLSKCHGAPGMRLGWAITRDDALRQQLVVGKFNTVISNSVIDEAYALRLLERAEPIVAERRRRLLEGLRRTEDWVGDNSDFVEWIRPDAGALCCIRLKAATFDDIAVKRFYEYLARQEARVANGSWFGDETRVFRLGFGFLAKPELEAAFVALNAVLRQAVAANGRS